MWNSLILKHSYSLFFFLLLFLQGCSDNATVNIFDKKITQNKTECMRLVVFPPDKKIEKTLNELYPFNDSCPVKLEVNTKSSIVCNSNQNSQRKALSNFPTSYLKMQISKNNSLKYSYYIDLSESVTTDDVKNAFERIKKDLILNYNKIRLNNFNE